MTSSLRWQRRQQKQKSSLNNRPRPPDPKGFKSPCIDVEVTKIITQDNLAEFVAQLWAEEHQQEILDSIFAKDQTYKHCMYCGMIYSDDWKTKIYQNGVGGLGREFNEYNISTGVGPCCQHQYEKQIDDIKMLRLRD